MRNFPNPHGNLRRLRVKRARIFFQRHAGHQSPFPQVILKFGKKIAARIGKPYSARRSKAKSQKISDWRGKSGFIHYIRPPDEIKSAPPDCRFAPIHQDKRGILAVFAGIFPAKSKRFGLIIHAKHPGAKPIAKYGQKSQAAADIQTFFPGNQRFSGTKPIRENQCCRPQFGPVRQALVFQG